MALKHVLLGLLTDGPDHAYALKRRLSPGLPREQLINDGVLYPLLAKLEAGGLVNSSDEQGPNGRRRRVYSVTRRGAKELRRWLASDDDERGVPLHEVFVTQPLVKLLFAPHMTETELRAKLELQRDLTAERINALSSLQAVAPVDGASELGASLLELELSGLRARLKWLVKAVNSYAAED
jgi:DNA-binding PadR family transcriptional regulator